ncbi:MAG: PLP-dependent aminotransferase family protein [Blautia sp.]
MLTYSLEERGDMPLYEYLYQKMKEDILAGKLTAGEKLPSKRSLARHLQVGVITVENAYAQLAMEGYIYSLEKRGYFVSQLLLDQVPGPDRRGELSLNTEEEKMPMCDEGMLDLAGNRILPENFPFSVWSKLMRRVLLEQDTKLLEPMPNQGVYPLRKAIAAHLQAFRGMEVAPGQIVVGAGTEYLYTLLIQLLGRRHVYGVENPGYPKTAQIYRSNEVECRFLPLDQEGLSMEALRQSDANVIHISPGHHFPTGIVMPVKRRQELLAWAAQDEMRYVIEDDYDSEFRFQGRLIPTLQSIDRKEKVIYMNTFSKTMAPSIRISYMVLPPRLVRRYQETLAMYSCTVPSFEQYTLARFLEKGYFEQHINRMRTFYRNQRNQVIRTIRESALASKVKILEEDAGLHFLLEVDTRLSDEELVGRLRQCQVLVKSLKDYTFGQEDCKEHMLVVNYSGVRQEQLQKSIALLEKVLDL